MPLNGAENRAERIGQAETRKPFGGNSAQFRNDLFKHREARLLAGLHGLCKVNAMETAVKKLFEIMPFLFGIGFIAPLIAQTMAANDLSAPFDVSPITLGLAIGGTWGLIANIRGRWL